MIIFFLRTFFHSVCRSGFRVNLEALTFCQAQGNPLIFTKFNFYRNIKA